MIATRKQPAFLPDSAIYLGTAQNLRDGHGVSTPFNLLFDPYPPRVAAGFHGEVPLTMFPPLYPAVIAFVSFLGGSLLDTARALNAFALGASTVLVGLITYRIAGLETVGVVAAVGFAASSSVLFTHASVMSDPLLLVLLLAAFLFLDHLLGAPSRLRLVIVCECCAFAALTRFAGLSMTATAVVAVLLRLPRPRADRFRWAAIILASGVVPLALWLTVGEGSPESTAGRKLLWHPPTSHDANSVFHTVSGWLVGADGGAAVRWVAIIAPAALLVWLARDRLRLPVAQRGATHLPFLLTLFLPLFAVTLVLARTFTDALFPMDVRNLLPLYAALFLLLLGLAGRVLNQRFGRVVAIVVVSAATFLLAWPGRVAVSPFVVRSPADVVVNGISEARPSPLARAAEKLPRAALIATNRADLLYLQTGRGSISVPANYFVIEGRDNPDYAAQLVEFRELMADTCGYLVMFDEGRFGVLPSTAELGTWIPLVVENAYSDGAILQVQRDPFREPCPPRSDAR